MSKQYKAINPVKYYKDYLAQNIRPDGRTFTELRSIGINVNSITTADGSAIVKLGNTTVVCGIKAELGIPKSEQPDKGFLVPNIELSPLSSSQFRPGPPSEQAQVYSQLLADIIEDAGCVDRRELCVCEDKLVWVLYCDVICLDYDGSVIDASVIAVLAALKTVKLPYVDYDGDVQEIVNVDLNKKTPLKIHAMPIAITFVIFDEEQIMVDPTLEEENLCSGTITIVIVNDHVSSVHKPGGTPIPNTKLENCITESKRQANYIIELLNNVFK